MKNLAAVIVFLIVIAVLVKYGMDRYLEEGERHNKFLEDRIDRDGLHYILKPSDPAIEEDSQTDTEPDPGEVEDPESNDKPEEAPELKVVQNGQETPVPDPVKKEVPRHMKVDKVSDAVKVILKDWQLVSNKEFIKDLTSKTQSEFVNEYVNDILGEQICIQFGLSNKKGNLYKAYKARGVKKAQDMSAKVLIQLYKYAKGELKTTK